MKGLVYTGKFEEGVDLMLYHSYKTVRLAKYHPYVFNESDDTSHEAAEYYTMLGLKVGFKPTDNDDELVTPSAIQLRKLKRVQLPEAVVEAEKLAEESKKEYEAPELEELSKDDMKKEEAKVAKEEESTDKDVSKAEEVTTTVTDDNISGMNESELSEYLDMNYDIGQLKEIATALNVNNNRRDKSKAIRDLLEVREDLIKYLIDHK